jgi:DNA mismatch repair protein MutL
VPIIASKAQNAQMLMSVIDYIKNDPAETVNDRNDYIIKKACKSAVKSDRELNDLEIRSLISDLIKTKTPFVCPHGRDVIVKFKKSFVDSLFGR